MRRRFPNVCFIIRNLGTNLPVQVRLESKILLGEGDEMVDLGFVADQHDYYAGHSCGI